MEQIFPQEYMDRVVVEAPEDRENFVAYVDMNRRYERGQEDIIDMGICVVRTAAQDRPMIVVECVSASGTLEQLGQAVWKIRTDTRCPFWVFDCPAGVEQYIKIHYLDRACVVRRVVP